MGSWQEIKAGLQALSTSDEWGAALRNEPAKARAARITAWMRVRQLEAASKAPAPIVAPTDDLVAFRCFMEATDDPARIQEEWQALLTSQVYLSMKPESRAKIEGPVRDRMAVLLG